MATNRKAPELSEAVGSTSTVYSAVIGELVVNNQGKNLAGRALGGAAITMGGQAIKIAIQFLGIVFLARLLDPADYGLLAMVTTIVGVGEILRDFGLSSAAIQAQRVSSGQRNNLFWLNTAIGTLLALAIYIASGAMARFYGEPRLVPISQILASTFIINGMATQYRAQLSRNLNFSALSFSDVASQFLGLLFGIGLALAGGSYWALVAQQIAQSLTALLLMVTATRWIPGKYSTKDSIRPFLGFGWSLMASQILGYASRNIGQVIIGNRLGADAIGLYNRAFQLLMMPLNQINAPSTTVALPVLSRLQDDSEQFNRLLLRGQTALLHLVISIFSFSIAFSHPLIVLALGEKWRAAADVFRILSVGGIFQAAAYAAYWVFLAKGHTRQQLIYSIVGRTIVITVVLITVPFGLIGVAIGYAVGLFALWILSLFWIGKITDVPAWKMFTNSCIAIVGYGMASLASYLVMLRLPPVSYFSQLSIGCVSMIIFTAIVYLVWPAFRRDLQQVISSPIKLIRVKINKGRD
ncbi:lipopolysaccharide biosynthesis protein [[Pseudomonas] boreopolis]|uniref:lipopolysaccharide biosynthesis protein n=1 Tax=Xanthomonas boreopolis TaxID=86183 RepID=UPI003D9BEA6D